MTSYALDGQAPRIHEDSWVAPEASVIGDVTIEQGVGVWFGARVRGDTETIIIGAGSNVQENCVLHADPGYPLTIGENCTIGHKVMLHGCVIGDGTLIGMGSTILNGAKIGAGCLIGAGALITEGKEIPDGSLVMGAPGKVIRQLDAAARAGLLESARHYQDNMRRFRSGLTALT